MPVYPLRVRDVSGKTVVATLAVLARFGSPPVWSRKRKSSSEWGATRDVGRPLGRRGAGRAGSVLIDLARTFAHIDGRAVAEWQAELTRRFW
jgi:hypothetical protein